MLTSWEGEKNKGSCARSGILAGGNQFVWKFKDTVSISINSLIFQSQPKSFNENITYQPAFSTMTRLDMARCQRFNEAMYDTL